jgi:hypothetical protein
MTSVLDFIDGQDDGPKAIMLHLHNLMMSFPEVTSKISYKIPFYYRKSWICYMNPVKDGGVELGFTRGQELSNEQGILEAKGRKQVAGIIFYSLKDIPERALLEVINEAIILDESVPYNVRKSRKEGE